MITTLAVLAYVCALSLFFVLVILLLSRLLTENKELRDDNSMFI